VAAGGGVCGCAWAGSWVAGAASLLEL